MIDKLEEGKTYKLIDKGGYFESYHRNQDLYIIYFTDNCITIDIVDEDGEGLTIKCTDYCIIAKNEYKFFELLQEHPSPSNYTPREKRKMDHLNESAVKFAERLKRLGGTCRASKAADILGVKRQTINNRLKAKKLLAVQVGGESKFPTFQFDGNLMVDGLEEVLLLLGDFSPVTKTSFLTAMYFFDDEENLNIIDALKKYGTAGEHMKEIRKQADLFGHQASH